jgi:hypothetical protein
MDGSLHSGSLNATTLWHIDAVEWAPSTASIASFERCRHVGFTPDSGRMTATQRTDALGQEATYALQQIATYSITSSALASVAIAEEPVRDLPFRLLRVPEPLASLDSEFVLDLGLRGSAQLGPRWFTKTLLVESRQSYLSTQTVAHATAASTDQRMRLFALRSAP